MIDNIWTTCDLIIDWAGIIASKNVFKQVYWLVM